MRLLSIFVAMVALAAIAASAGSVLTKDSPPMLAVKVEGVPGYIYYERDYDLAIGYTNLGGAINGPVELAVVLPETFALSQHLGDLTRHGERLVWQLDGLDSGESGTVNITVQGTLPDDLTNAVYDLPGYEGHTAFVEGFEMAVTLRAANVSAETLAVADTGATQGDIVAVRAIKNFTDDGTSSVDVSLDCPNAVNVSVNQGNPQLSDNQSVVWEVTFTGGSVMCTISEMDLPDYDESVICLEEAIPIGQEPYGGEYSFTVRTGFSYTCTFTNSPETGAIAVHKDCDPDDNADGEFEITLFNDDNDAVDSETIGCNEDAIFEGLLITDGPFDAEETEIEDGFVQTGSTCDNLVPSTPAMVCEIENTQVDENGTIIIEKDIDPEPDSTVFSFSDNIPSCNIGNLADDGAGGLPSSVTCSGIPAGNYQVSENASAFTLVDIDCVDPDGGTTTSGSSASIDLDPGETIRCTFHNVPGGSGSITIEKETNPDTNGVFFSFHGDLGNFNLQDDGSKTYVDLVPGIYEITESEPLGWNLTDIICNGIDVNFSGNTVLIDLDPGKHVTCEFVNQLASSPQATPTKTPVVVIPVATATPTKTPVPPVVGPVRPPSAGDAGLLDGNSLSFVFGIATVVFAGGAAWAFFQHRIRRSARN